MSKHWVRFRDGYTTRFGTLEGDRVRVCEGDMFTASRSPVPAEGAKLVAQSR